MGWCDDIILFDDSEDETVSVAKKSIPKSQLRVVKTSDNSNFAQLRNDALLLVRNEWVLFLDGDEEVPGNLQKEIRTKLGFTKYSGFYLKRNDHFLGTWLKWGETGTIQLLKLGKKSAGVWRRRVHEVWDIKRTTSMLQMPLHHYPHPSVAEFVSHINRWTTLDAQEFFENGNRSSFWKIVVYPIGKFVQNYLFRRGFRDGMPGLLLAILMSFHSFLTRAKLYLLQTNS